jgi:hypothetical protein
MVAGVGDELLEVGAVGASTAQVVVEVLGDDLVVLLLAPGAALALLGVGTVGGLVIVATTAVDSGAGHTVSSDDGAGRRCRSASRRAAGCCLDEELTVPVSSPGSMTGRSS